MKRALLIAGLVVLSLAATFAAQKPGTDSPIPSVNNRGPRGVAPRSVGDVVVIVCVFQPSGWSARSWWSRRGQRMK